MKRFKQADLCISITLITGFGISVIVDTTNWLAAYLVIGGWQVISMLVHVFTGAFMQKGSRRIYYHWISGIALAMGALTPFIHPFGIIYFIMFFAALPMAIYYCHLCFGELKTYQRDPLTETLNQGL